VLNVAPQVLHRHSVIGVLATFATLIPDWLKDKTNSPPHRRHKRLAK
jgi:hypothetical protein